MAVDPAIVALVLLAALMHAGWNAVVKMGNDRLLALLLVKAPTMLVAAATLAVVGPPAPASWPYLLVSTVISMAYFYFLVRAYHAGDLGLAYPVARGSAPVVTLLLSFLIAGERPTLAGAAGVLIVSAGIIALGWQRNAGRQHAATVAWAMAVGLTIAGYTISDGIGGRLSGNPIGYAAALNLMTGLVITVAAFAARRGAALDALRFGWRKGLGGGLLMFGGYAIVIYAMTLAPMASIAALRETSVIFAALIGSFVLREKHGARRIAASTVVAVGIVVLLGGF
ncbi:MAG: EamA family transporter [Rhodospirillales bacterium]|nr:EamA family transporter [Rhodospirillales bacterium]